MSDPTDISPETENAAQPDVRIVPAEFFFVEEVEVPTAVTPDELADYAELSMEGLAPFPLEQLRWGFLTAADGRRLLIYAALNDRLLRAGYKDLQSYSWVLPDFAPLQGTPFEALAESPAEGHWAPLSTSEASLWNADIRPASYKSVERSARRTTTLISRVIGYAALFACLLLILEALLFAGQLWLGTRGAKVEAQSTAVRRVEDKESLMNKLEQVAQNELRPIAMLEAANQIRLSLGSTGIEYDEVVIEGGNRLTIEGKANTINELNAYTEALRKSGNFELSEAPKYITRSGKTTFSATLDYQHGSATPGAALASDPELVEEVGSAEPQPSHNPAGGEDE